MTAGLRRSLCLLLAAASVASVLQAAPAPPAFATSHDAASNPGHYRVAGEVSWEKYIHYNKWKCHAPYIALGDSIFRGKCKGFTHPSSGLSLPEGITDDIEYTTCEVETSIAGCGHNNALNGWRWDRTTPGVNDGHHTANTGKPGSRRCTVNGATFSIADDATTCGVWVECTDGILTGSDPPTGCDPCPEGHAPNTAGTACEPRCAEPLHKHAETGGTYHGNCQEAHAPPSCVQGLSRDFTGGRWGPGHEGSTADGHVVTPGLHGCGPPCTASETLNAEGQCVAVVTPPPVPVRLEPCDAGEHRHAAAAGGHTGCRAAHAAPSCTWSASLTWSPGHGGPAADGHSTTAGMTRCRSARVWCADDGSNAFAQTVSRQRGVDAPEGRGVLADGFHRDRIPYGDNLYHDQFKPSLTWDGQSSPGRIAARPGRWAAAAASTAAPTTGRVAAEAYDWDEERWRGCGRVSWTRTGLAVTASRGLETAGGRARFPAGACPAAAGRVTVTATWRVHFDATAGPDHDVTETDTTTTRWDVRCSSTAAGASSVCDAVEAGSLASRAFDANRDRLTPVVFIAAASSNDYEVVADYLPPVELRRYWADQWAAVGARPGRVEGETGSAVLAKAPVWSSGNAAMMGWSLIVDATAVNRNDRTVHVCGRAAFRLKSLTWSAGPPPGSLGSRRGYETTDETRREYVGSGVWHTWGQRRYDPSGAAVALPFACSAVWPAPAGGAWDPWTGNNHDQAAWTSAQVNALRTALQPCDGAAFWAPAPAQRFGSGVCGGVIGLTVTAEWEAGVLKDGQPLRPPVDGWAPGERFDRVTGFTPAASVTAAEFAYPFCPVLGF